MMRDKRPNIVLIMTDQQRWDTLGCYGNDCIETANLDWLASQGTVFKHAYTPSPSCVPARACLMTGMNTWQTGILGMGGGQGGKTTGFPHTLPGELAKAGYHTQGVGKMHFHPQRSLNGFHHTVLDESGRVEDPGFVSDYKGWFDQHKTGDYGITDHGIDWNSWMARPYHAPEFLHPSNWTVNESIAFLERRDPNQPFFLKTSFARPHSPYDAPEFYFNLYLNKKLPMPAVGDWAERHDDPVESRKPFAWRGKRSEEEIHRARAGYYGLIHHIDHQIGRLLMYLNKNGLMNNTLIMFMSDHGDMLGDHHLWRKTYAYEGSAHIPMIVKLPASLGRQKQIVEEPVTLQDIMPTVLEAAGVSVPDCVDGSSMVDLMLGKSDGWRSYVHGEHSTCYAEEQETQYLTDGKMKYVWLPRLHEEQLFDLESDPMELCDLKAHPDKQPELLKWRQRLIDELAPRNAGLTDEAGLVSQAGKPYLTSPNYKKRIEAVRS
ncbi:arylsulfatase [Paenibacillus sp. J5C2022]|uniref:arylsulfatase n=1 Tax=Paenibacillus sp. J5C2022 TaxID=2977129 RepID=UPI0021D0C37A|nr:arylsulfatase [Paenibacillus sp. J5C2022]